MATRTGGMRRKTRHKTTKGIRSKGKISLTSFFRTFSEGDRVQLAAEPAYQKGCYFFRFHGKSGKISGKKGDCYTVSISDLGKKKELIVHPVHLKKI